MDTMCWLRLLVLLTLLLRVLVMNVLHMDMRPKLLVLDALLPQPPVLATLRLKLLVLVAELVELALPRPTAFRRLAAVLALSLS